MTSYYFSKKMASVLLSNSQNYYSSYTNYSFLKLSSLHLFSFIFPMELVKL